MFERILRIAAIVFSVFSTAAQAEEAEIRVVDVGAGLCVVASFPDGWDLLYDAGHWQGSHCLEAVVDMVDDGNIEMIIISHPDSDHLGELPEILEVFWAGLIIHTGFERWAVPTWVQANTAIAGTAQYGATILNLGTSQITPGDAWELGDATVTFIAGWHDWDLADSDAGNRPQDAEMRNVISIVMSIEYAGQTVLLTGDTIGRRLNDPDSACRDAESWMVNNSENVPIEADVLIAPHHGANNGSSACFLDEVDPDWVIYSAGGSHHHPTSNAAGRAIASGVAVDQIFRTDRIGKDEGTPEWTDRRPTGCTNPPDDDSIQIKLNEDGVSVSYLVPTVGC